MLTESSVTLYIQQADGSYQRVFAARVHKEDHRMRSFNTDAVKDTGEMRVFIPIRQVELPTLRQPGEKQHFLVEGDGPAAPAKGAVGAFTQNNEALTIQSIFPNRFGSPGMQHWEVVAV